MELPFGEFSYEIYFPDLSCHAASEILSFSYASANIV